MRLAAYVNPLHTLSVVLFRLKSMAVSNSKEALPLPLLLAIAEGEGVGVTEQETVLALSVMTFPPSGQRKLEMYNIIQGLYYLQDVIESSGIHPFLGLLDFDWLLLGLHKVLMQGLIHNPGALSTQRRFASYEGVLYEYPHCLSPDIMEAGLIYFTDRINTDLMALVKDRESRKDRLCTLLSKFYFTLLTLHPFSDGNGRTARLLLAYLLRSFTQHWMTLGQSDDLVRVLVSLRSTVTIQPIITSRNAVYQLINDLLSCDTKRLQELMYNSLHF